MKRYIICVKNAKTGKVGRVYPGQTFGKVEAARRATNLDRSCKPHLSYWAEAQ